MYPDYPHKKVCSALHKLVDAGGGKDLVFRFRPNPEDEDRAFLLPIQRAVVDGWRRADVLDAMEHLILWILHLFNSKADCMPVISFDNVPADGAHPGPSFICKNLTDPRTNLEQAPRRREPSSDTFSLMPLSSSEVQNLTYVVLHFPAQILFIPQGASFNVV
jgi:hypothetical protein